MEHGRFIHIIDNEKRFYEHCSAPNITLLCPFWSVSERTSVNKMVFLHNLKKVGVARDHPESQGRHSAMIIR